MGKRGAVGYLESVENKRLLKSLIIEFDKKENIKSKITYNDIFEYVKKCNLEGRIDFYPSLTWWKTKGKEILDSYNEVKKKKVRFTETDQLDIVDIEDLIEKHVGDKKALIKYLKPYNMLVDRMVNRISKLEKSIEKNEEIISSQEQLIDKYEKQIKEQRNLINNLFYLHISNESNLMNLMSSEDGNCEIIRYALEETFINPEKYIEEFKKILGPKCDSKGKVISIYGEETDEDDFEF